MTVRPKKSRTSAAGRAFRVAHSPTAASPGSSVWLATGQILARPPYEVFVDRIHDAACVGTQGRERRVEDARGREEIPAARHDPLVSARVRLKTESLHLFDIRQHIALVDPARPGSCDFDAIIKICGGESEGLL